MAGQDAGGSKMGGDGIGSGSGGDASGGGEYEIPRVGRIKLKATKDETAAKLYRREQRRYQKEQHRISLANGYAVSPPRASRAESMSPPRRVPRPYSYVAPPSGKSTDPILVDSDEEDGLGGTGRGGYKWMGGAAASAMDDEERREEREKMRYMAECEMADGDPFAQYSYDYGAYNQAEAVPRRYRPSSPPGRTVFGNKKKRDAAREVQFEGGPIPNIAGMTEAEYTEFIRAGMDRLKRQTESSYIARENAEKERKERERLRLLEEAEEARRKAEKAQRKRLKQQQAEERRAKEEQDIWVFDDFKKAAREHYRARWAAITKVGGEIEETRIAYNDIPWPVYYPAKGIEKAGVREFMVDLAKENGEDLKKGLREAIRAFHPDRFFGRILPRTNEGEREKVKAGVEGCIRVINDLLAETRT